MDDYFRGLKHFPVCRVNHRIGCGLIYGGKDVQQRSNYLIYPATAMEEMFEKLNHAGFNIEAISQ